MLLFYNQKYLKGGRGETNIIKGSRHMSMHEVMFLMGFMDMIGTNLINFPSRTITMLHVILQKFATL